MLCYVVPVVLYNPLHKVCNDRTSTASTIIVIIIVVVVVVEGFRACAEYVVAVVGTAHFFPRQK
jgi:hypothetical protein